MTERPTPATVRAARGTDPHAVAAVPAGWARVGRSAGLAATHTLASARAPGRGALHRACTTWLLPAAAAMLVGGRGWYEREDAAVLVAVRRPERWGPRRVLVLLGVWLVLSVASGWLRDEHPGVASAVLGVWIAVLAYLLSVLLLVGARDRADQPVAERRGPLRARGLPLPSATVPAWRLARVARRSGPPASAVPAARALVDALLPHDDVLVLARTEAEQAAWVAAGFAPLAGGDLGVLVRHAPGITPGQ